MTEKQHSKFSLPRKRNGGHQKSVMSSPLMYQDPFPRVAFTYTTRSSCFSFSFKGRTRITTRTLSSPGEDGTDVLCMDDEKDDNVAMVEVIRRVMGG